MYIFPTLNIFLSHYYFSIGWPVQPHVRTTIIKFVFNFLFKIWKIATLEGFANAKWLTRTRIRLPRRTCIQVHLESIRGGTLSQKNKQCPSFYGMTYLRSDNQYGICSIWSPTLVIAYRKGYRIPQPINRGYHAPLVQVIPRRGESAIPCIRLHPRQTQRVFRTNIMCCW